MFKRLVLVLGIGVMTLAMSRRAEAIYTRAPVPFAWKFSSNLEMNISSQDDALSGFINLPFWFPFQDDAFDQIRIHSNGFVTLTKGGIPCGSCYAIQSLGPEGNPFAPDYTLAPWWADWNPLAGGEIFYGPVDDAFVVEWWDISPFGAPAGQTYRFSLQLFPDGRFRYLYMTVDGGFASRDNGNTASIGYQGRGMARFGETTLFATGIGGTLSNNTAFEYTRVSDSVPPLSSFDLDPNVPDIVERWAPVIWADISQGQGRCDYLTYPMFDNNFNGADNALHSGSSSFSMPAAVHYSLMNGATHDYIGYYFYHARDCTQGPGQGHDHDWEGITIAVNRATGALDAVLTNVHGREIPYHSPFDNGVITVPHHSDYSDTQWFSYFSMRNGALVYDTLGVGIEAETHSTWGRWHNRCVIGTEGSASGCNDEHGGDGVVYTYGAFPAEVGTISGHPNWFNGSRVSYALRPLRDLYAYALQPSYCGQNGPTTLYACQGEGRPWDVMDGLFGDAGDLPWVWSEPGVVSSVCTGRNVILEPGFLFDRYFLWSPGRFNGCQDPTANPFVTDTHNAGVCNAPMPSGCPAEIGPVSEESGKFVDVCSSNRTGLTAVRCAGSYCDDMYLTCSGPPAGFTANSLAGYWTAYFSEEAPSSKFCSPDGTNNNIDGIIDGVRASGSYGDNISFHCAKITSGHMTNCSWTAWFSEEQGLQYFDGKYAIGAQCSGSYCDNLRFLVCNLGP